MEPVPVQEKPIASRLRLTGLSTLVAAVVTLCAGLALMSIQHQVLTSDLDDQLDSLSANIEHDYAASNSPRVLVAQGSDHTVAQIVFADSTVLSATANMEGQRALATPAGNEQYRTTTLPISDTPYRLLSRRVGEVVIHVAVPADQLERADDALRVGLAFVIPAMTLLFGFLAWWLIGRRAPALPAVAPPADLT